MKKLISFIALMLMLITVLNGCTNSSSNGGTSNSEDSKDEPLNARYDGEKLSSEKKDEIQGKVEKLVSLYNAEKQVSQNWPDKLDLSQETIDAIETTLIEAGYPIMNSDSIYPDYLENAQDIYSFWEAVQENRDAETEFWEVLSSGALYYGSLQYADGEATAIYALTEWNEQGKLEVRSGTKKEVLNWDMTSDNNFYYQDVGESRGWDAARLLRLKPVDKTLYDLNAKYIMPIGYYNVNLFLCDWDTSNYGSLCFNDLFEALYRLRNNDYIYARDFEQVDVDEPYPYYYCCIPAEIFDATILPYFEIPLSAFREKTLYDSEKDIYPWQDLNCSNIAYFPTVIPEVTEVVKNEDGSITLKVTVMCLDKQTDCLFTHEVTVMPSDDGEFKYLGNKITFKGQQELPLSEPRIPAQRTKDQEEE
ncbi:MAG: hypothetical protein HFJ84_04135 [Clostridiales bacterium]|jgi:hypothetical protein|nr:hypothetical protein [Clostridiales bacterium]